MGEEGVGEEGVGEEGVGEEGVGEEGVGEEGVGGMGDMKGYMYIPSQLSIHDVCPSVCLLSYL